MISKKILNDSKEEFAKLRESITASFLSGDYDIDTTKEALRQVLPNEVMQKVILLLDTLLNYLMDEAIELLKDADLEIRNAFFRARINEKIQQWAKETTNKLLNETSTIDLGKDIRLRNGLIAGGVTFLSVATLTKVVFTPSSTTNVIVAVIITIASTFVNYKFAYNKSSDKVRKNIEQAVKEHLNKCEKLTNELLESVIKAFSDDFKSFCVSNNINFDGEIL